MYTIIFTSFLSDASNAYGSYEHLCVFWPYILLFLYLVRGYNPAAGATALMDSNVEQDTIRDLSQRKQVGAVLRGGV